MATYTSRTDTPQETSRTAHGQHMGVPHTPHGHTGAIPGRYKDTPRNFARVCWAYFMTIS